MDTLYDAAVWRLTKILEGIRYKPGWEFEVNPMGSYDQNGCLRASEYNVRVTMYVPNVENPTLSVKVSSFGRSLPSRAIEAMSEASLLHYVLRIVEDMELHEAHEWLRFDGRCVKDPHPPPPDIVPGSMLPTFNQDDWERLSQARALGVHLKPPFAIILDETKDWTEADWARLTRRAPLP